MEIELDDNCVIEKRLSDIACNRFSFEDIWSLHPDTYHYLTIHGRRIQSPRWQQSYGANYRFSGAVSKGFPVASLLQPYLDWCQKNIHADLNAMLVNWYDADLKHYIGKHRDDTRDLLENTPIVTISLGAPRTFRMRPYRGSGFIDTTLSHGDVLIIPEETNAKWTHEVPHFKRDKGRRISITCRAYRQLNLIDKEQVQESVQAINPS